MPACRREACRRVACGKPACGVWQVRTGAEHWKVPRRRELRRAGRRELQDVLFSLEAVGGRVARVATSPQLEQREHRRRRVPQQVDVVGGAARLLQRRHGRARAAHKEKAQQHTVALADAAAAATDALRGAHPQDAADERQVRERPEQPTAARDGGRVRARVIAVVLRQVKVEDLDQEGRPRRATAHDEGVPIKVGHVCKRGLDRVGDELPDGDDDHPLPPRDEVRRVDGHAQPQPLGRALDEAVRCWAARDAHPFRRPARQHVVDGKGDRVGERNRREHPQHGRAGPVQ
eukprot:3492662-Prymnesium_polylepis.1